MSGGKSAHSWAWWQHAYINPNTKETEAGGGIALSLRPPWARKMKIYQKKRRKRRKHDAQVGGRHKPQSVLESLTRAWCDNVNRGGPCAPFQPALQPEFPLETPTLVKQGS